MKRLAYSIAALIAVYLLGRKGRRAHRINAVIASAWRTPVCVPNRVTLADELEDIWN